MILVVIAATLATSVQGDPILPREVGVNAKPRTERASPAVRARIRGAQVSAAAISWNVSFGSVIGTLVIFALISHREWLRGKARRLWDTTLKQATVYVVCHGFVLCGAAWHAALKTLHSRAT